MIRRHQRTGLRHVAAKRYTQSFVQQMRGRVIASCGFAPSFIHSRDDFRVLYFDLPIDFPDVDKRVSHTHRILNVDLKPVADDFTHIADLTAGFAVKRRSI